MKKTISILFFIICSFFFTINVEAADLTKIRIDRTDYNLGETITNSNSEVVSLPSGMTWNNTTKVITLNNYNDGALIVENSGEDLKLYLKGTNTIGSTTFSYGTSNIGIREGKIIIDGDTDGVLNLVDSGGQWSAPRNIFQLSSTSNSVVEINNGTVNINTTTDGDYINGIYAKTVNVNNGANLNINVSSSLNKIHIVDGICGNLYANGTGNISIVSSHNGIDGFLYLNSKGNVYVFGKQGKSIGVGVNLIQEEGATVLADYDIYGESVSHIFYARYKTVAATEITANNITMDVPVALEEAKKSFETSQFNAEITWNEDIDYFEKNTIYTATINIYPKMGYKLGEFDSNYFTVQGATSTTYADGVITATFPSSGEGVKTTINPIITLASPVGGKTMPTVIETEEYTANIKYYSVAINKEVTDKFLFNTVFKAEITIVPKEGYTMFGIPENGYSIKGLTSSDVEVTNEKNSTIVNVLYKNATASGMFVTIGTTDYIIDSLDETSYANLPTGISYNPDNNRLILNNYTGTTIYSKYHYNNLYLHLIGKNYLTGDYTDSFSQTKIGIATTSGNLMITADEGGTLNINMEGTFGDLKGIFVKDKLANLVAINSAIVNININHSAAMLTNGIASDTALMGTGRLNINIKARSDFLTTGIYGSLAMTSTGMVIVDTNSIGTAILNDVVYESENYSANISEEDYLKLAYNGTYALSLNTLTNGTCTLNPTTSAQNGQTVSITNIAPQQGYLLKEIKIFDEYNNDVTSQVEYDSTAKTFIMPSYNVKVKVDFEDDSSFRTITKVSEENGTFTVPEMASEGTIVSITNITPAANYIFKYIRISNALTNIDVTPTINYNADDKTFEMPSYDIKIDVIFEKYIYSITKATTSNGSFTVTNSANVGSTVNITVNPSDYYELNDIKIYRVSDNKDVSSEVLLNQVTKSFKMPAYDVKVNVSFKPIQYTIQVESVSNGTVNVVSSATYNSVTTITATPNEGYALGSIKILNVENEDITSLVNYNTETKTFKMPNYEIRIVATFIRKEITEYPELSVDVNSYESLKLSWTKVESATGYKIYRATSKTGTYRYIKTITDGDTISYINSGLTLGKSYYYKIKAYNDQGTGPASTYKGRTVRIVPTQVKVSSTGYAAIKISWDRVSGASGYVIYRSTDGSKYSAYKTITSGSALSYTDKSLTLNKAYYYKVKAYRTVSGKRIYSYYSNAISSIPYLKAATSLSASSNYYRYVKVMWNTVSGATGYRIYRSEEENSGYKTIGYATSTIYYDKTAEEGKTYYYKVRPYRKLDGKTYYGKLYSEVISGERRNDSVTFSVASNNYTSVTVSISKIPNATKYYVYRATSKTGTYSLIETLLANDYDEDTIVYTNTGLTYDKVYYYKVKAYYKNAGDYTSPMGVRTKLGTPKVTIEVGGSFRDTAINIEKVSGASGYEIYRSNAQNGPYSLLKRTTSLKYVYELTTEQYNTNKTYYYLVKAYKVVDGVRKYGSFNNIIKFVLE